MGIYCTMRGWTIDDDAVLFQRVAGDIDDVGPAWDWLGPPVPSKDWDDTRAVFVVCSHTQHGSKRNGQEYVNPLMRMSINDYGASMATRTTRNRLRTQLRRRIEIAHRTDGA